MIGPNGPMLVPGEKGGTIILGDLTIVQNHTFGMPNQQLQMMQMQQQMAIQQQQNQMMLLGMANMLAKEKQKNLELSSGYNDNALRIESDAPTASENLKIANSEDKSNADTVDCVIIDYDSKIHDNSCIQAKESSAKHIPKHMTKFFINGELSDEFSFNKFYKVDEDTRTFVIFIKKNAENPAAWRKIFRDAYRTHLTKVIKSPIDTVLLKQDSIYIAILFSTQGGKPDIIFIDKKENGRGLDNQLSEEFEKEYVDGIDLNIGHIYRLCEPFIPETSSNEIINYHEIKHPCCHVRDTLFSNALYLMDDM